MQINDIIDKLYCGLFYPMPNLDKHYEELSKCSKCGFCQAFCPVYAVTGIETEVARGRNVQLQGFIEGKLSLREIEGALSSCLLCKACVPSCFTGVKTDEIVRDGRETLVKTRGPGFLKSLIFNSILPHSKRTAAFLKTAFFLKRMGFVEFVKRLNIATEGLRAADALMENVPKSFLNTSRQSSHRGSTVAYFRSCGFSYLLPETGEATIKLIENLGYDVVVPENNCCGLPPYAHGYTDAAKRLAKKNIEALEKYDVILTECGSCSSFLKKYADILLDDRKYSERAKRLSDRILDSSEFIFKNLNLGQPQGTAPTPHSSLLAPRSLKVTYHDPCHLSRYQNITKEPREIIKSIPGVEFIELPEADWCCGGAGSYSIENNEISMKILERKMNNVKKTGADILATSCPACMIQLSYGVKRFGLNTKVMHVNQLLGLPLKTTEVPAEK